jgi:hypothetical protein
MGGVVVGLVSAPVLNSRGWAANGNPNPRVIPPGANPFGQSYSEWSAEWWQWQLGLPATDHPVSSLDGANCGAGQSGKVWFLTGAFTTEVPANEFATIVRESCAVPTGKAILFPIANIDCSTIEPAPFRGETPAELLACAKSFIEGPNAVVQDLSVTIDGEPLENLGAYRSQSPVFNFTFADPEDNLLGVDCSVEDCENAQAVSDGYWIMLPPLSAGEHEIRFTGSFRDPLTNDLFFGLDVTYELTVVGSKK